MLSAPHRCNAKFESQLCTSQTSCIAIDFPDFRPGHRCGTSACSALPFKALTLRTWPSGRCCRFSKTTRHEPKVAVPCRHKPMALKAGGKMCLDCEKTLVLQYFSFSRHPPPLFGKRAEYCFGEENSLSLTEFWGKLGEFWEKLGEFALTHK